MKIGDKIKVVTNKSKRFDYHKIPVDYIGKILTIKYVKNNYVNVQEILEGTTSIPNDCFELLPVFKSKNIYDSYLIH